ncbi:MAG TPA: response regulator [Haliangiales bacterium]|nr:response regulator [Haliangiales bacterium]
MPKILVIEDNPVTRKMVRAALTRDGFQVEESGSAQAAIQAALKTQPDLILQDLVLPDMSGFELLGRLRAQPGWTDKPIVALTGLTDQEHLRGAGFTDVLIKPVEPSRLVRSVRSHLARPVLARGTDPENRRHLLLVDGDATRLGALQIHFRRLGFLVTPASDGMEALALARASRPDVIVADILVPQLSGFELLRAVREDVEIARLPVILVTPTFFSKADRDLADDLGAITIRRTPDMEPLVAAVESAAVRPAPPSASPTEYHRQLTSAEKHDGFPRELTRTQRVHQATLTMLAALAGVAERKRALDEVLREVLTSLLDACGLASGAVYLADRNGALRLRASGGFTVANEAHLPAFWGHLHFLRNVMARGEPIAYRAPGPSDRVAELLRRSGAEALLLAPLILDGNRLGMLVFAASGPELPDDWVALAKSVSLPIAQAVAVARAVEGLLASELRFRGVADTAADGMVVADEDGNILYLNAKAEQQLGLLSIDARGRLVREVMPFVDAKPGNWRGVVHTRDGRRVPIEVETRVLPGAKEILHCLHDLSHRETARRVPNVVGRVT